MSVKNKCKFKTSNLEEFEKNFNSSKDTVKEITELLTKPNSSSVLPNDDFYTFINEEWIKNVNLSEKEKYITQIDDFRLVQNKVYSQLIDIVNEQNDIGMNKIYKAGLARLSHQQVKKHIHNYKTFLEKCIKEKSMWSFIGAANRNEIYKFGLPIVIDIYADEKASQTMRVHFGIPQTTLVDNMVYYSEENKEDEEYYKKYKDTYFEYIRNLSKISGEQFTPENIWEIENLMLFEMFSDDPKTSAEDNKADGYFKMTPTEIEKCGINWPTMASYYGFNEDINELPIVICQNKGYFKRMSKHIKDGFSGKMVKKWKEYYLFLFIKQLSIFTQGWKDMYFDFHGKFMRGQKEDFPNDLFPIFCLAFCYNTKLTRLYIDKYADEQMLDYVRVMANDMKLVFRRKIERNNWMQPETKTKALEKLDNFKFEFGEPSNLGSDPPLDNEYVDNDIYANFLKVIDWRTKQTVSAEGLSIVDTPTIDWTNSPIKLVGSQAYVVNAMYVPSKNGIYIPLGYIQEPFVDLKERGIEYNLAHIGFTLGHEMSHSLDDLGSQFDAFGNMHNWWSKEDKQIFKEKQKDVADQYSKWYLRDGIKGFDAMAAIGESIADIAGLSICMEYLEDFQTFHKDIMPIKALSFKSFFIYYAFQMRQRVEKSAYISQLRTNVHPLSKFRCSVPLSRIQMFRNMYNVVSEKDGMWWHNTDTIY